MRKSDWHGYVPFRLKSLLHTGNPNDSPEFSNHNYDSITITTPRRFEMKPVR